MFEVHTSSQEETMALGQRLGEALFENSCVILEGDLGAGKTTFTKGIALGLGIDRVIKSPTYTLIREYRKGRLPLFHMDVYRLEGEADSIDFDYYYNKNGVTIIEWGDTIKEYLPEEYLELNFKILTENKRVVYIKPIGEKYENLCGEI